MDSPEEKELRQRVEDDYFPTWCAAELAAGKRLYPATFRPDWSFLTPGIASAFLTAICPACCGG